MSANKITPLKALQRKKRRLQTESDLVVAVLEDNFQYIQDNFGSLVGHATVDAVVSKLPPFVQNLLGVGHSHHKEEKRQLSGNNFESRLDTAKYSDYVDKALDIVPFFAKGPKGLILTFLLKKAKDLVFGRMR